MNGLLKARMLAYCLKPHTLQMQNAYGYFYGTANIGS